MRRIGWISASVVGTVLLVVGCAKLAPDPAAPADDPNAGQKNPSSPPIPEDRDVPRGEAKPGPRDESPFLPRPADPLW